MIDKLRAMRGLWHESAPHILPCVSVYVPPSILSNKKTRPPSAKIPSEQAGNGKFYNMRGWQDRIATDVDIVRWAENENLGFGIRCAYVRAVDIDVEDAELVKHIYEVATQVSGDLQRASKLSPLPFAIRRRTGSYRCGLLYKTTHFEALPFSKIVIQLPGELGKVEFLGNAQYIALHGNRFNDNGEYTSHYFFQRFGTDYEPKVVDSEALYPVLDQLPILSNEDLLVVAKHIQDSLERYFDDTIGMSEDFSPTNYFRGFGIDSVTELGEEQLAVLESKEQILKEGNANDGRWFVKCPWEHQHTTDNGDRDAMFIPDRIKEGANFAATFKCFHGHCEHRTIEDYAEEFDLPVLRKKETSIEAAALEVKTDQLENCVTVDMLQSMFSFLSHSHAVEIIKVFASPVKSDYAVVKMLNGITNPLAHRRRTINEVAALQNAGKKTLASKGAKVKVTTTMIINAMRDCNNFGFDISFDTFLNDVKIRKFDSDTPWQKFMDRHIAILKMALNKQKFPDPSTGVLREAITLVAETNTSDCALDWIDLQEWDGVSRLKDFIEIGWNLKGNEYLYNLAEYIWTALAGRILSPGCQADMIPIFIGFQGAKKSSFVKMMAPYIDWYTHTALDVHDSDIARKTIGKCVLELPELSGLKTRALESIKAWVTTQVDNWVPKYKESAYQYPRRWIAFGSGNDKRLFTDSTGNRRWLPIDMTGSPGLNLEWLVENRNQLWAEGKVLFNQAGISWEGVSQTAGKYRTSFKPKDIWYIPFENFFKEYGRLPTVGEAFQICLNIPIGVVAQHQVTRAENVLAMLESDIAGGDSEGIVQRSYVAQSPPVLLSEPWEF